MSYNFFIIGGDLRNFYLSRKLKRENNNVTVFGFDKIEKQKFENENIKIAKSLEEIRKNDIIISAIPLTMDNKNVYSPLTDKIIPLQKLANHNLICGKISEDNIYSIYKKEIEENDVGIGKIEKDNVYIREREKKNIEKNNFIRKIENKKEDVIEVETINGKIKIFDVLKYEPNIILNTVPTAEGAIAKAIEETAFDLNGTNILVTRLWKSF